MAAEQRERATRDRILAAAKSSLIEHGYAGLSTRRVADEAGVPLSQIHYHFGSKMQLFLDLLAEENERLLDRQATMFGAEIPLWKQWEMACDFLDDDVDSGYVRVLNEMVAAGWSEPEIASAVRARLMGWLDILTAVAAGASERFGGLGPYTAREVSALAAIPFLGAESVILLGFDEDELPVRSALRKIGDLIKAMEEQGEP